MAGATTCRPVEAEFGGSAELYGRIGDRTSSALAFADAGWSSVETDVVAKFRGTQRPASAKRGSHSGPARDVRRGVGGLGAESDWSTASTSDCDRAGRIRQVSSRLHAGEGLAAAAAPAYRPPMRRHRPTIAVRDRLPDRVGDRPRAPRLRGLPSAVAPVRVPPRNRIETVAELTCARPVLGADLRYGFARRRRRALAPPSEFVATALTAVEFDPATRQVAVVDPRPLARAAPPGRDLWIDVALDDPADDAARLAGLGVDRAAFAERALAAALPDACLGEIGRRHLRFSESAEGPAYRHLDVLLERRLMVTLHRGPSAIVEDLRRRVPAEASLARSDTFLVYALGVSLLDAYRAVQAGLEARLTAIQRRVIAGEPDATAAIPGLDGELLAFRRAALGARNVLSELGGRPSPMVGEPTQPYLSAMALALDRLQQDALASRGILTSTLGLTRIVQ